MSVTSDDLSWASKSEPRMTNVKHVEPTQCVQIFRIHEVFTVDNNSRVLTDSVIRHWVLYYRSTKPFKNNKILIALER